MAPTHAPHPINDFLGRIRLAPRQSHKALSLWPLLLRDEADASTPPYTALGTALAAGTVTIGEVSADGSVPHVRVTNHAAQPVLFLFGEEIRGAKQNRIANASFLVGGKSEVILDVSCVEQGRWASRPNARFARSDEVVSHSLRRKMHMKVAAARAAGRGFDADQGEVWSEVGARLSHSRTASPTASYADYRSTRVTDVGEISEAFHPVERQVGFVACMGDDVTGAELIGHPSVFRDDFQALLRSYAIDAVDAALVRSLETRERDVRFDSPESFLSELSTAPFTSAPSLGEGDDLRVEGPTVSGCALVAKELVHLTAFPAE